MKKIKSKECIYLLKRHFKMFLNQEKNKIKIHLTLSLLEVKGLVIQDMQKGWQFWQELRVRAINTPGLGPHPKGCFLSAFDMPSTNG